MREACRIPAIALLSELEFAPAFPISRRPVLARIGFRFFSLSPISASIGAQPLRLLNGVDGFRQVEPEPGSKFANHAPGNGLAWRDCKPCSSNVDPRR